MRWEVLTIRLACYIIFKFQNMNIDSFQSYRCHAHLLNPGPIVFEECDVSNIPSPDPDNKSKKRKTKKEKTKKTKKDKEEKEG